MAITVVSITTTITDPASTTHLTTLPTRVAGDRLIFFSGCHSSQTPTGDVITNYTERVPVNTVHGDTFFARSRVATNDASDAAGYTSGSNRRSGQGIVRISQAGDVTGVSAANGTSETPDPPSIALDAGVANLVFLVGASAAGLMTLDSIPANYGNQGILDFTDGTLFWAYRVIAAGPSSEDAGTFDKSEAGAWAVSALAVEEVAGSIQVSFPVASMGMSAGGGLYNGQSLPEVNMGLIALPFGIGLRFSIASMGLSARNMTPPNYGGAVKSIRNIRNIRNIRSIRG